MVGELEGNFPGGIREALPGKGKKGIPVAKTKSAPPTEETP